MICGWTVAVFRRGSQGVAEYWDCAITSHRDAEDAVRAACSSPDVTLVSAFSPITANVIRLMRLKDGEIRRRSNLSL